VLSGIQEEHRVGFLDEVRRRCVFQWGLERVWEGGGGCREPYSIVKFLVYGCNSRQCREFYLSFPKNLNRTPYIILAIFHYILADAI